MVELKLPDNTKRFLEEYNPNHGGLSDKFEVEKVDSEAMKDYMNCFKEWNNKRELTKLTNYLDTYQLVNNYEPTSVNLKNIQDFIYKVEDYYKILPDYAGLFLSYLSNELCSEEKITLEIEKPWNLLGFKNSKILEIDGNCGGECGYKNERVFVVNGDCGHFCGYRNERVIVVNGDCERWCGEKMERGNIVVEGDCGENCGDDMKGGEIHLNRDYESIGDHSGGKIYHLGTLIYENGVEVN